jgi:hypothetical protein
MSKHEWIVYDSHLAEHLGVDGIVLYPFILIAKKQCDAQPSLLKHELTHVHQLKRHGFCVFYAKYFYYIIQNLLKSGNFNTAFIENEFEYEAYGIENEPLTDDEIIEIGRDMPRTDKEWFKNKNQIHN